MNNVIKRLIAIICVGVCFLLASCRPEQEASSTQDPFGTAGTADEAQSTGNGTPGLDFGITSSIPTPTVPPSYDVKWTLPNSDEETLPVVYDGTPIKMQCSYENVGSCDFSIGFRVYIAGIVQEYTVEEAPGKEYEIFSFSLPQGEKKEFHLLLTPNVGNAGDKLEMSVEDVTFPDYVIETNDLAQGYAGVFSGFGTMNVQLAFEAGSPTREQIDTAFSGEKVSDIDPLILMKWEEMIKWGNYENRSEIFGSYLYVSSVSELINADEPAEEHSDFQLKANENQQLTINLCGMPGKYRVAFFVNHEALPVFDGCRYADTEVFDNKQTELIFHIDTTRLNAFNHCYYTVYKISDTYDPENLTSRSFTQKLNITV